MRRPHRSGRRGPHHVVEGKPATRIVRLGDGLHILDQRPEIPVRLSTLNRLFDYQDAILAAVGGPTDVEWLITDDVGRSGEGIQLLQARPISRQPVLISADHRGGIPASPGGCTGPAVLVDGDSVDSFTGGILVAEITETRHLRAMQLADGIVTEQGGLLSHAAIVARERNIPCVVAVPGARERFAGKTVTLDGNSGEVWVQGEDQCRGLSREWLSAETQFNCEEWFRVEIPVLGLKVGCEPAPSGVIVHTFERVRSDDAVVREFVARAVGRVEGVVYDSNKALWIEEWSRMRKIRPILDLAREGVRAVLDLDEAGVSAFYRSVQDYLDMAGRICPRFPYEGDAWFSLAVGEWCHAVNMLAAASVPEGYGMKAVAHEALELGLSSADVFRRMPLESDELESSASVQHVKLLTFIDTLTRWREWAYPYMLSTIDGVETYFSIRKVLLDELGLVGRESEAMDELYGRPKFHEMILKIARRAE